MLIGQGWAFHKPKCIASLMLEWAQFGNQIASVQKWLPVFELLESLVIIVKIEGGEENIIV